MPRCSMRSPRRSPAQAVDRDRRSCLRHRLDPARALHRASQARQNWRLVDNDLSLLARISAPSSSRVTLSRPCRSIFNLDLEAALDGPVDLVTTSALLDLVSDEWLERLDGRDRGASDLPIYAALSYDGRAEITPRRSARCGDHAVGEQASAQRQRFWSGARARLRPAKRSSDFEALGYSVVQGPADWVLRARRSRNPGRDAFRLGSRGARSRRSAARRHRRMADTPPRRGCRRALVTRRRSRRFFRARRPPRAEPTDRSRTAPRRRAEMYRIGMRKA